MSQDDEEDTMGLLLHESRNPDPLPALRAIRRLRTELERSEATAVRRARVAGASWADVAGALGVTRQAAHRKYGGSRR